MLIATSLTHVVFKRPSFICFVLFFFQSTFCQHIVFFSTYELVPGAFRHYVKQLGEKKSAFAGKDLDVRVNHPTNCWVRKLRVNTVTT